MLRILHSGRCALYASVATLSIAATTPAQNILVVDRNQGPGSSFTDIQSAIDAAQPGDRIHVRDGTYGGFVVDKPISVVGSSSVTIFGANRRGDYLSIEGTPAGSDTTVRDLQVLGFFPGGIGIRNCQGRVLLDAVGELGAAGPNTIEDCAQVMLNRCNILGRNTITRSTVTACNSGFAGASSLVAPPTPGLDITDSEVFLSQTSVGGGWWFSSQLAPAIQMADSVVTAAGPGALFTPTPFGSQIPPAAEGSGRLVLDPDVTLGGPVGSSIQVTTTNVPSLAVQGGGIGGQSSVHLLSQPGESFLLFAGRPGDAVAMPAHGGTSWIDAQSSVVVATGTLDAAGAFSLTATVPAVIELVGEPVMWLAAAGTSTLLLSNNAGQSHGF